MTTMAFCRQLQNGFCKDNALTRDLSRHVAHEMGILLDTRAVIGVKRVLLAAVAMFAILGDDWGLIDVDRQARPVVVSDSRLAVRTDSQRLALTTHFKVSDTGQQQSFK